MKWREKEPPRLRVPTASPSTGDEGEHPDRHRDGSSLPAGAKSFVGPADDAFFVDLGAVFDGVLADVKPP
jgi:hypothetical protein